MTSEEERFVSVFKIFEQQVADITQFWFAVSAINEVASADTRVATALLKTPAFWNTVRTGLEYQAIVSAGKLFGNRKQNPHNIDSFFAVLEDTFAVVFSAVALENRKRQGSTDTDSWLPEYMKDVFIPNAVDIRALRTLVRPHRKTYEAQWAQIRNQHVAHTEITDYDARWEVFQKARRPDFETLVRFLHDLYMGIWHLYHNGRQPLLEPTDSSARELVARDIRQLRESRYDEYIVAETRKCLALLTAGTMNTSSV